MNDFELGICIPVLDEMDGLPGLLAALDSARSGCDRRFDVAIGDNGSTDGSWELLGDAAAARPYLSVVRATARGPGYARTAAAQLLARRWRDCDPRRCWVLSCDADNVVDATHVSGWVAALAVAGPAALVTGSYAFTEDPLATVPEGAALKAAWADTVAWCEAAVGVVNATGANHAVRVDALRSVGWYRQPVSDVVGRQAVVAGDDWDLGVRLGLAGATTLRAPIVVRTSARRFFADPAAYLTGRAHDGEFRRIEATSSSLEHVELADPLDVCARALSHFLVKPVLLGFRVEWARLRADLPARLVAAVSGIHGAGRAVWDRSRDEFIYGLLPDLGDLALALAGALARRLPTPVADAHPRTTGASR